MFKKKQQRQPSSQSPSMESLPSFMRSPAVPRFNSPFPPLHPDKKYKGVYERAGFDVFKGNYETHKHSHDPRNPSDCRSMDRKTASNTPSPSNNATFPRNFTAPNPFPTATAGERQSEPDLTKTKSSRSSANSHELLRQRNFSESTVAGPAYAAQRPVPSGAMKSSASSTNFNYVSAYSTPVVDSAVKKTEDIKMNNYVTPVKEEFDTRDKDFVQQQQQDDTYDADTSVQYRPETNNYGYDDGYQDDSTGFQQNPYTGAYDYNNRQTETYDETPYPTNEPADLGLSIHGHAPRGFSHESTYAEQHDYQNMPRLSQLVEEEIGASPKMIRMNSGDQFYDASPVFENEPQQQQQPPPPPQEEVLTAPQIVIDEDYDYNQERNGNIDASDDEGVNDIASDDGVEIGHTALSAALDRKKPTYSTYATRDATYDALTGGGVPERTPNIPSEPFYNEERNSHSTGAEDNYDSVTDPATETTARTSNSANSFAAPQNEFILEDEIDTLTNSLNNSQMRQQEPEMTPEMQQDLDGKFVHHKIRSSPARNLNEATEPLSLLNNKGKTVDEQKEPVIVHPSGSGPCRKCGLEITGKSIWSKDGQLSGQWHRNCFSCHECAVQFNKGTNCYVIKDYPYCEQHFHELNNSLCGTCGQGIEGTCLENEKSEKFHPHCLSCSRCGVYIDKDYFIVDGYPLCEADGYAEIEREKSMLLRNASRQSPASRIEKRRTRLLQI